MNDQSQNKPTSQFLKTDGGKTKSNAIEIPSISLPKGGGAIKGIDEKFSMQQNTKDQLSQVAQEFIASKGLPMVQRLNLLDGKRDYTVDDFLEDLYVNNIFEKIEEEEYIARYRELCSNYEIKVSVEDVHGENLITYFQSEKF